MRLIIILFAVFSIQTKSISQMAVMNDIDGYVNVRNGKSVNSEIVYTLNEYEVFWYDPMEYESDVKWINIVIPLNKFSMNELEYSDIVGYVHKSRILPLSTMKSADPKEVLFSYDLSPFKLNDRVLEKDRNGFISAIDGRNIWGTDGDLPKIQVDDIHVEILTNKIEIHKVFFNDIFECDNQFKVYKNKSYYYIEQRNSDGAGSYEIVWVFNKERLIQRAIGFGMTY